MQLYIISHSISPLPNLSLHFNGHFPGEPGLAGFTEAKDDGGGGDNWTTGAISHAKLQSNHHHQQTNIHSSNWPGQNCKHFLTPPELQAPSHYNFVTICSMGKLE